MESERKLPVAQLFVVVGPSRKMQLKIYSYPLPCVSLELCLIQPF